MGSERAASLWQAALAELKGQVSRANFETWLRDTVALSYEGLQLTVGAPSGLAAEWLRERMSSVVHATLARLVGQPLQVSFVFSEVCSPSGHHVARPTAAVAKDNGGIRLNPRYTFSTFVVGSTNRLAHAAAQAAAEKPGDSYNPLFIYGATGLGKTHLLHAVGHSALKRNLSLLYVSCEQFTNEFINAIREQRNEEFRRKFRGTDLLLMDDIQFIAGKEQTQEEFFHTFNELHGSGRQIVISSDRHPRSMPVLEDRLSSRFQWGLIADIQPPDFETRLAILRSKADLLGVNLTGQVLEYVAQKVQNNIRELEGSLNRLAAHARLNRTALTLDSAAPVLRDYLQSSGRRPLPLDAIVETVCKYYGLEVKALAGKKRDRDVAVPRQIAMYLLREETQASLKEIGRALGGKDHSTVLHGHHKISTEISANLSLRKEVMELKEILYSRRFA